MTNSFESYQKTPKAPTLVDTSLLFHIFQGNTPGRRGGLLCSYQDQLNIVGGARSADQAFNIRCDPMSRLWEPVQRKREPLDGLLERPCGMHLHSCSTHLMAGSTHLTAGQRCSDLVSSTEYSLTIFAGVVQGNHLYTVGRKSLEVVFGNAQSVPPGQPVLHTYALDNNYWGTFKLPDSPACGQMSLLATSGSNLMLYGRSFSL